MSTKKTVDAALELIKDLKATQKSGGRFTAFDERRVAAAIADLNTAHQNLDTVLTNPYVKVSEPYFASSIQYHRAKVHRTKRCLLAYLLWRLNRISTGWWDGEDDEISKSASTVERSYLQQYGKTMVEYMSSFPINIDLRAYNFRPPCATPNQVVEVRGLTNRSFLSPTSGLVVEIYAGKVCCLGYEDTELLLQEGAVALVSLDEHDHDM